MEASSATSSSASGAEVTTAAARGVDGQRHAGLAQAPVGVLGPGDRQAQRDLLAGGQLLAAGEDPLGGLEVAELVQRLAEEQRAGRIQLLGWHRLDQPPHDAEVVRVAGQVGAADQDGGVGPAARRPAATPRSAAPPGPRGPGWTPPAVGLGSAGSRGPATSAWRRGPPRACSGMGQAHLPSVDRDRHQPGPFQRLQHPERGHRLQVAELHRLAQGEQLDDGTGLRLAVPRSAARPGRAAGLVADSRSSRCHTPGPLDQRPRFQAPRGRVPAHRAGCPR